MVSKDLCITYLHLVEHFQVSTVSYLCLIFTLLFRTFSIVSDFPRFHAKECDLKEILKKNAFPIKLIDSCIESFLNKRLTAKPVINS